MCKVIKYIYYTPCTAEQHDERSHMEVYVQRCLRSRLLGKLRPARTAGDRTRCPAGLDEIPKVVHLVEGLCDSCKERWVRVEKLHKRHGTQSIAIKHGTSTGARLVRALSPKGPALVGPLESVSASELPSAL